VTLLFEKALLRKKMPLKRAKLYELVFTSPIDKGALKPNEYPHHLLGYLAWISWAYHG